MSNKIEQSSDNITEVNTIAKSNSQADPIPSFMDENLRLMKTEDPLKSNDLNVTCIYLQDGRVIFGIILYENSDSFLVGAGARLIREETGEIICEPIVAVATVRLMKSSVTMISAPLDKYRYEYYLYLKIKGVKLLPEFLAGEVMNKITSFINSNKNLNQENNKLEQVSLKEEFKRKGVLGVSDKAFYLAHVSEKIN